LVSPFCIDIDPEKVDKTNCSSAVSFKRMVDEVEGAFATKEIPEDEGGAQRQAQREGLEKDGEGCGQDPVLHYSLHGRHYTDTVAVNY